MSNWRLLVVMATCYNNDDEDNPDYLPKKDTECLKNKK